MGHIGLIVAGVILALFVGRARWALGRAMRPALRRQAVKYDHSWLTNTLGETSTPHRKDDDAGD